MCVKSCVKENFTIFARKTSVNMSVRFTLEKRTNKYGESPIRLSWSFSGHRYQTTLGYSIKKVDWDEMRRLVKNGAHNYSGQKANDINYYIKRISLVVTGIEQQCFRNKTTFGKDRMKQAISEALSNDIASTEDIIERCLENIASIAKRYYKDLLGRYYQFLCEAKYKYNDNERFYILQELFDRREYIALPPDRFKPIKEEGIKQRVLYYKEVSYEEVFPFL